MCADLAIIGQYPGWGFWGAMEVLDLATSAGINISLAILFLVLYSVFRKNPRNAGVYSTRQMLRERRKEVQREPFSLDNLLPSPGWLVRAWNPSEGEILESAGLDAVVFLRIFKFWSVQQSSRRSNSPGEFGRHFRTFFSELPNLGRQIFMSFELRITFTVT